MDFYEQFGGKVRSNSLYDQLRKKWKDKARTVCLAQIDRYLSWNNEGKIVKAFDEKKFETITKEEIKELKTKIRGFLAIVERTKTDVQYLKTEYKALGIGRGEVF